MEQCTICGADVRHHILCRWPHLITSPLRQFNLNDVMEEEKHMMVPQRLPSITPAESVEGIGGVQGHLQHESAQTPSQSGLTDGRGYRRALSHILAPESQHCCPHLYVCNPKNANGVLLSRQCGCGQSLQACSALIRKGLRTLQQLGLQTHRELGYRGSKFPSPTAR